ncbi:MAG: SAM-dependent methyltransferase [Gammaproteobacteria bacterium]|nr:SAM-dependent methyltransferase [Gammaproteobacteria bacterium]
MKKFLHAGCGPSRKENTTAPFASSNWEEVRFDIDEAAEPDILGSVLDLGMIESESFDAIFSSHNIEHIFAYQVPKMLREFLRILNKNGFFVVTCPNLIPVARLIVEDKLTEPAYVSPIGPITPQDILYGHSASLEQGNEYMAHKTGFTPKSLQAILLEAGFQDVAMLSREGQLDIWALATKSKVSNKGELKSLAEQHLPIKKSP